MNYTMSKQKLLSAAVILLLTLNLGMIAFQFFQKGAHGPQDKPPLREDEPKNIIIERLHLDKKQIAQYENLIKEHQRVIKSLNDSVRFAKNNLYHSLAIENFSAKDSLIRRLGGLQDKIELTHYNHFASIREICRPEQVEDFNKLTQELAGFFVIEKKDRHKPRD